mmetsp:Transcript_1906/g.2583  ORF Transcript_1906/g.2583 Transcript_1906/m.2583 type:complete len:203 (+) Transcript_1906:227-835(+)
MSDDESYDLKIIRTDGVKTIITTPLSITLKDLKDKIHASPKVGQPCLPIYQRLFHLGRELKSPKRTLRVLNVGRFRNFIIHLQSTQPPVLSLNSNTNANVLAEGSTTTATTPTRILSQLEQQQQQQLMQVQREPLLNPATTSTSLSAAANNNNPATQPHLLVMPRNAAKPVIELLDDDDDDDNGDEDDDVAIVATHKRRRVG